MTTAVQHRRGTTAEHAAFTGLEGEVTIDTTKDTAVIHDGTLAGGYPLAKENLANVTTSGLSSIDGASTASDDKFFIFDQSATSLKTITRAELNNAIEQDALANVAITGGTINGTAIGGTTPAAGAFTTLSASGAATLSGLTASTALALDGSKNIVSVTNTGTGSNVLATSPTLVTPALGTPSALVGTNITGTATSFNINGTVGATTPASGAFTTLSASSTVTLSGGTANGVAYLNGSKVVTSGSALTFDGTNFGIGAATALKPLDISFAGTSGARRFLASYDDSVITIKGANASNDPEAIRITGDNIRFNTGTSGSGSEVGRFTSTGLGIGTSSPSSKLTVASTGSTIELKQNGTGAATYYVMDNTIETGGKRWRFGYTGGAGIPCFSLFNQTDNLVSWVADASGNLGLGVTPSAWTTFKVMQLGNFGAIGGVDSTSMNMFANTFYDGAFKYINTSSASRYRMDDGHSWFTAPSGTAGNAITFTQAMTLTSGGNLLVGTTTNYGSRIIASAANGTAYSSTPQLRISGGSTNNNRAQIVFSDDNLQDGKISYYPAATAAASYFSFSARSTESDMILDGAGNLLVGTTGAVLSSNTFFKGAGASNPCLALIKNSSSSSTDQAFVVQNGNAGGTTSFQVLANGNAQNTNNSYGAISDAKLKDVIGKAPSYWDKFKQYEFVNYTLKADKSKLQLLGLVAQQVEQISPSLIEELPDADKDGNSLGTTTKGIKYSVVTLQAEVVLQEAQNRIEQLEAIIESLKARLDAANL